MGGLISIRQSRLILVYCGSFVKLIRVWGVFLYVFCISEVGGVGFVEVFMKGKGM